MSPWPLQNPLFSSNKIQIIYVYKVIINAKKKKKNYDHHVYFPITPPCYMLVHRTDGRPAGSP